MHPILKQDERSCVLACMVSLMNDYKLPPLTQQKIADGFPSQTRQHIKGQEGSIDTNQEIVEVLTGLGFDASDNFQINPHSECFVLTRNSSHCCRYQGQINVSGEHVVMDPDTGQCTTMSNSKMTEQSTTFIKIMGLKNNS